MKSETTDNQPSLLNAMPASAEGATFGLDVSPQSLLEGLMEISVALVSGRTRQEVLDIILRWVHESGLDRVRLFLLSPDGQTLNGVAQLGMSEEEFAHPHWETADDWHFQEMLREPQPYIFTHNPAQPDPNLQRFGKEDLAEWVSVPLLLRGRLIGHLAADNKFSRRIIKKGELIPLALFATLAAAAIEKAGLIEQAEHKAEQLEELQKTTLAITSTVGQARKDLLPAIVAQAAKLLRAKSAGLYEYHAQRKELELVAEQTKPEIIGNTLKLGEGMAGRLIESGGTSSITCDYSTEPTLAPFIEQPRMAVLEVLVQQQGRVVGVLYVDDETGREFSSDDAQLLSLYANQAAVVLDNQALNARDSKKLQLLNDYKERLEFTLRAITTVASAQSLREGLQQLVTLLIERFPNTFSRILLLDENETALCVEAAAADPNCKECQEMSLGIEETHPMADFPGLLDLLRTNEAVHFSDANPKSKDVLTRVSEILCSNQPIESLFLIPLKFEDQVLGFLELGELRSIKPDHFAKDKQENRQLATAIATQARILIARLLFAQREKERTQTFYQVSQKLLKQTDPKKLLQQILEAVREAAGAVSADFVLIDNKDKTETLVSIPDTQAKREKKVRSGGISMRVYESGVAASFPDTSKAVDLLNPELLEFFKAAICLPLSLPHKRVGVLWLHYAKPRHFSEQEIPSLLLYGNQAAVAYENAREKEQANILHRAANALAREHELDGVRKQIVQQAQNALKAKAVIFGFYDENASQFIPELSKEEGLSPDAWSEFKVSCMSAEDSAQRLLQNGVFFIHDPDKVTDPTSGEKALLSLMRDSGFRSCQTMALKSGKERLGLVCAFYDQPQMFGERERLMAATFGHYVSLALKKVRLSEHLKTVYEATDALTGMTVLGDLPKTLNETIKAVQKVTRCDAVTLFKFDRDKQEFSLSGETGLHFPERVPTSVTAKHYEWFHQLLHSAKPYEVVHIPTNEDFKNRRFAIEEGIESFAAFPLRAAGEDVGLLFINYRKPHNFTAEELKAMQLLAKQAALAIDYAQSTEAGAQKLLHLEALRTHADLLRKAKDLQEMMDITVEAVVHALSTNCCNLILKGADGVLKPHAQYGWEPRLSTFDLDPQNGSQVGYTIDTRCEYQVNDYQAPLPFKVVDHLVERGIKSSLSVPMFRDEEIVGALITFTKEPRRFTEDEIRFLKLIAAHTATAMRSRGRLEELARRDKYLTAVHHASQAILTNFGNEQSVLDQIVKVVVENIVGNREQNVACTLQLYDAERNEAVMRSVYPPGSYNKVIAFRGRRWSLDKSKALEGRIGVSGRTILKQRSQLVGDLSKDEDYIEYSQSTQSELSVPLKLEGKAIGAINVESDQPYGFDEDDQKALELLADEAVMAIQIARTYETLRETKGLVGTRTSLAFMGMTSSAWRHAIDIDAASLANRITLLRQHLALKKIEDDDINRQLVEIELLAAKIKQRPITLPLTADEGVAPINLNEFVVERIGQLQQHGRYHGVRLEARPCAQPAVVSASTEWLRRVLDNLVHNGARAASHFSTTNPSRCVVTVSLELDGAMVALRVADRGPGIPPEILNQLFNCKVEPAQGSGVGLLITQAIVETYGGTIKVSKSDSQGTEFLLKFPLCMGRSLQAD